MDYLPSQGRPIAIHVRARRFRCFTVDCPRRVFAERLPLVAAPRARRSQRLGDIQRHIGMAVGGEPGSRLAHRLAMPVSGDTLLRLIRSARWEAPEAPRVIGVDEWAWKRGDIRDHPVRSRERARAGPPARPRGGHRVGLAEAASGRGGHRARPRHGLRPGHSGRRSPGHAGSRPLAPAPQPR